MSLRITQGMLFSRALQDIRNSQLGFARIQQQAATGRRVNAPSDDPIATLRIIPLTAELRDLGQLLDNNTLARESMNSAAAGLEDASSIMQRVRELTTQAANGSLSEEDRHSIAGEMNQLLEQMVSIANSSRGDRYVFGGTVTDTTPFSLVSDGGGSRVLYGGNQRTLSVRVAPGIDTSLNIPGDAIFQSRSTGNTVFEGMTGAAPSGASDNGAGFRTLQVSFNGLHTDAPAEITAGSGSTTALGTLSYAFTTGPNTLSIDGGPALSIPATDQTFTTADGRTINLTVTGVPAVLSGTFTSKAGLSSDGGISVLDISDFTDTNAAVRNSFDGSVLNVDVTGITKTGDERATLNGSFDVFTTLISLRDILTNESGDTPQIVTARTSAMLDRIDGAHEDILDGLRELGFRSSSMELLRSRVENISASSAESLSLIQDTDIAEAILQLQQQDLAYRASLQVGARVLQTSLMNYLS
jgi:flagellar hook-associated protein 3 FlgL